MAERDEVGGYLLGKKSQLGVGLLGSPFEQFEGRRFIHPVDEHQHAFCPLDVYSGLGDNGHGGGHLVLVFSFRRGDVNVVAVGAYHRAVGLAQEIPDDNDVMDSALHVDDAVPAAERLTGLRIRSSVSAIWR